MQGVWGRLPEGPDPQADEGSTAWCGGGQAHQEGGQSHGEETMGRGRRWRRCEAELLALSGPPAPRVDVLRQRTWGSRGIPRGPPRPPNGNSAGVLRVR